MHNHYIFLIYYGLFSDVDSSVAAALEKVRSGSIVTEGELQLACSHKNSGKVQYKITTNKNKGQKFKVSDSYLWENMFNLSSVKYFKIILYLTRLPAGRVYQNIQNL